MLIANTYRGHLYASNNSGQLFSLLIILVLKEVGVGSDAFV